MILRNTIKWELRKWWSLLAWTFGVLAVLWAVLVFIPVPQEYWHDAFNLIIGTAILLAGANAAFLGLLMIFAYPFLLSFGDLHKSALLEHQTARPYAYKLFIRLVLNVITYMLGIGVLSVTMRLLQRFEMWVDRDWFSNMLADSPVILLPMVYILAVGAPLVLLCGYKYFDVALSGLGNKIDGLDATGFFATGALTGSFPFMERIFEWLPFTAALAIMTIAYIAIAIVAVILISRFLDRFSEVSV